MNRPVAESVGAFEVVLDTFGRIVRLNPAIESLGIDSAEVVGKRIFDDGLVPPEHHELVARAFEAMLRDELGTVEVDMPTPAGRRRVAWNAAVERDVDGGAQALVATGVDITELRALEARFARRDRLDSISRLAAGVAHDFGNTLSVIEMRLERMRESADRRVTADVAAIERAIAHAAELIDDLVSFSRPAERPGASVLLDEELRGLVPTLVGLLDRSVEVTVDLGAGDARVGVDPARLHRVMVNLCANANDAMAHGGTLIVRSGVVAMDVHRRPSELTAQQLPDGQYAEVQVADTGLGVDGAVAAKIFEPYFTTKPAGRGTGLGLASVYGTIVQSGGAIHVDSAVGQGATFTFWLPLEGQ